MMVGMLLYSMYASFFGIISLIGYVILEIKPIKKALEKDDELLNEIDMIVSENPNYGN